MKKAQNRSTCGEWVLVTCHHGKRGKVAVAEYDQYRDYTLAVCSACAGEHRLSAGFDYGR